MTGDRSSLEAWAVGEAYEAYVGRWSRVVARAFVPRLGVGAGGRWLDVGCGAGALVQAILELAAPATALGLDRSAGFLRRARAASPDPRARFQVGDAQALPVQGERFDAVVSGLVLNFVPDPARMVSEMVRAARPGAAVGFYVWDYAGGMELIRRFWDAAVALDPAASALDEAVRFPVCAPEPLQRLLVSAGLAGVRAQAIDVPTVFRDFDDLWTPFLGGQGPAPGYAAALSEARRTALRERLRAALPFAADGSIPLVARAWAAWGARPRSDA